MLCLLFGLALLASAFENSRTGARKSGKILQEEGEYSAPERGAGDLVLSYQIEHSITPGVWKPRSSVDLIYSSASRSATAVGKFAPVNFTAEDLKTLKNLPPNSYYSVRLVNNRTNAVVSASVRASQLISSGFRELFVFHSDQNGNVMGLNYECASRTSSSATDSLVIQSKGKSSFGRTGEAPKMNKMVEAIDPAAEGGEAPPQSFLAKYWMYLIPVALILMSNLAGGAAPQEGGK